LLFKYVCRANAFLESALLTKNFGADQARPPEPVELERSSVGESQGPIVDGIDMDTWGVTGVTGEATTTVAFVA
jgi:hypothetical protein